MNETPLLMACAAATTISQVATLPGSISSFVLRRASTLSANAQSACSLAQCACMQASACAPTASRSVSVVHNEPDHLAVHALRCPLAGSLWVELHM